ncbi:MAG: hypothetical protein ACREUE_16815, partial [Panacagrimonas sp.]
MTQRKSRRTTASSERPRSKLDFERGDAREGRIGDPKPEREVREEFPGRREREAGTSGGETPDAHVTADDMAPETLLDPEPSHTPRSMRGRAANDSAMSVGGGAGIGIGGGLDEVEMAERRPVGARQAARTQRKSRQHAADPNMVEPHEAHVEHRHERLPARQEPRVLQAAEQAGHVGDRFRVVVLEWRRFHAALIASSLIPHPCFARASSIILETRGGESGSSRGTTPSGASAAATA